VSLKSIFNWVFPKGFWFSWKSKKAFDPYYQERTDGMDDIEKAQEKKGKGVNIK